MACLYGARLCTDEVAGLQCVKRILGKVQEMRDQRGSLEKQLRDLIQQDDITSTLVTTERADMKVSVSKDLLQTPHQRRPSNPANHSVPASSKCLRSS